jgi:hypothetical protein
MSVVSGEEVAACCKAYVKVNPNGVDLAPKQVSRLPTDSTIFLHGAERGYLGPGGDLVTGKEELAPDPSGF